MTTADTPSSETTVQVAAAEIVAALDEIRASPTDEGRLAAVVRRPGVDRREVLEVAELDCAEGLVGDSWIQRPSRHGPDGGPDPQRQLTLINVRFCDLVAGVERRALAGDQLYVDLDLSGSNLPAGSRLTLGDRGAVIEITEAPHTGCAKFAERFGPEVARFVNTGVGRELNLRGVNARVVQGGTVRPGDLLSKLPR